jgi:hypothetical protein
MPEEPTTAEAQPEAARLEVVSTNAAHVTTADIDPLVEGFISVANPLKKTFRLSTYCWADPLNKCVL